MLKLSNLTQSLQGKNAYQELQVLLIDNEVDKFLALLKKIKTRGWDMERLVNMDRYIGRPLLSLAYQPPALKALFELGADPGVNDWAWFKDNCQNYRFIHTALDTGIYLDLDSINLLEHSQYLKDTELLKKFIKNGWGIHKKYHDSSLLYWSANIGAVETGRWLLQNGAVLHPFKATDKYSHTEFLRAVNAGHREFTKMLFEERSTIADIASFTEQLSYLEKVVKNNYEVLENIEAVQEQLRPYQERILLTQQVEGLTINNMTSVFLNEQTEKNANPNNLAVDIFPHNNQKEIFQPIAKKVRKI